VQKTDKWLRHSPQGPAGNTGLAQVNGQRGETDALNKMQARIDYVLD
jgi:lipopolysaccharide/colanic/teichoic acid biosynthesis glycosyltransferase